MFASLKNITFSYSFGERPYQAYNLTNGYWQAITEPQTQVFYDYWFGPDGISIISAGLPNL